MSRKLVIFAGYLVRYPMGGHVQAELSCLLGLRAAGCEVYFVEASGEEWEPCYDPASACMTHDPTTGLRILQEEMERCGMAEKWCYIDGEGAFHGLGAGIFRELCQSADFLFSRAGTTWRDEFLLMDKRIYLDVDPGFTQMRMPAPGTPSRPGYASVYDFTDHFSVALNIGSPECRIPLRGLDWKPTRPFYVPELYEGICETAGCAYTTVMSWDAYGSVEWEGEVYGQKDVEFFLVEDLPRQTDWQFEMALAGGTPADRTRITNAGWTLRSANNLTSDRQTYLDFLARSRGEISVCKNGYAKTRSGWFSDRTLAYLAMGRPAVIQDTGIQSHLPVGGGLHVFSSTEEALAALQEVEADYERQSRQARTLAREFFDGETQARELLAAAGIS